MTDAFKVIRATLDDIVGYRTVQAIGWNSTYPNEKNGVPIHVVNEYTESWFTPEALQESREKFLKPLLDDPIHHFLYVAKSGDNVIGFIHASLVDDVQSLEALYVHPDYHGRGVAQALTEKAFSHFAMARPIKLDVVQYNTRAVRFYEKYGFQKVPDSEHLYQTRDPRLKLPVVDMIRKGETS